MLGGGGYVAGPVGLAAALSQDPARARRGRQPPRHHQPRAREPRAAASAWRSRWRAATGDRYLRHRPPRAAQGHRPRAARARSSGSAPTRPACSSSAARSARARSTTRRPTRSRTRPTASSTSPARATTRICTSPGPHYVLLDYLTPFGDRAGRRGRRRRPLGRLGLRARPVRPPVGADPVPARLRRPPELQREAGWPTRAPPGSSPTPS